MGGENEEAQEIIIRRLECKSPDGKDYVLNTTILDENIDKEELQLLYLTRWDIEISIREIKTIMDINILRSKTPEMALKELTVSLATYNLIRKVIHASTESLPFSPSENFIQKFYSLNKDILIDKKGESTISGQQVVEELEEILRNQKLQKRKPNRQYVRRTKNGAYRKYK